MVKGGRVEDGEEAAEPKRRRTRGTEEAERGAVQSAASGSTQRQGHGEPREGRAHQAHQEGRDDRGRHRLWDRAPLREDAEPRRVQESHRRGLHDEARDPHRQGGHRDHGEQYHDRRGDRGPQGRESACSAEAHSEQRDGTREMQDGMEWTPMWRRRPAWLYLPHQCEEAISDDVSAKRRRTEATENAQPAAEDTRRRMSDGGKDGGEHAAEAGEAKKACEEGQRSLAGRPREEVDAHSEDDAREIRGREASPGATAGQLEARDAAHRGGIGGQTGNVTGRGHQPAIRGPSDGPGAGTIERRISAQARLDARNAHLRTSLLHHAERVARRAAEVQHEAETLSAQERIMAIRRRLAERVKQNQEERPPGGGAVAAAASTEAWEDRGRRRNTLDSGS